MLLTPRGTALQRRRAWASAASGLILLSVGCSTDLTRPLTPDGRRQSASQDGQQNGENGVGSKRRSWHAKSGHTFTVDEGTNTLSDENGRSRKLTRKATVQISESFDHMEKIDAFLAEFNSEKRACRRRAEELSKRGIRATLRKVEGSQVSANILAPVRRFGDGVPTKPTFGASIGSFDVPGLSTDLASTPDYCTDIENAIFQLNLVYEPYVQRYNDIVNTFQDDVVRWAEEIQLAWGYLSMLRVQLDYLAIQYRLFGCWHQYREEPISGPGLPNGPYSGGSGVTCLSQWYQLVLEYDNGFWELIGPPFVVETCSQFGTEQ